MSKPVHMLNTLRCAARVWLAAFSLGAGCSTSKPDPNPLEGWQVRRPSSTLLSDRMIEDDYDAYIQALPPGEKRYVDGGNIWFLENSTGQTAVQIKIPLDGTWWIHALVYDKDKKRIKTLKYKAGRYRS